MVNKDELRRGNLVQHAHEGILKVKAIRTREFTSVNSEDCHFVFHYEDVDPIPLGAEVLERSGFIEWEVGNFKADSELCINGWSEKFNYYLPYNQFSTYCGRLTLKYLHELQNLYFALSKQELEIKL